MASVPRRPGPWPQRPARGYGRVLVVDDNSDGKRKTVTRRVDVKSGFICGSILYAALFSLFIVASYVGLIDPFDGPAPSPGTATLRSKSPPPTVDVPGGDSPVVFRERAALSPSAWLSPPLPGERVSLVFEVATVTGRPPLLCRADMGDPSEESVWGDHCPRPSFFVAAAPPNEGGLYAYIRESEDVARDVFIAVLASPGRALTGDGRGAADVASNAAPDASEDSFRACKASPVTRPYFCAGPLVAAYGYAKSDLWVVDVGAGVGYFALLAASLGFPAIAVDEQPHCAALATAGALTSGLGALMRPRTLRLAAAPGSVPVAAPARGCTGSSTSPGHTPPSADDLRARMASVAAEGVSSLVREDNDRPPGPALANASAWEERVPVPVTSLDALLLSEEGGEWPAAAAAAATGSAKAPLVLLLKVRPSRASPPYSVASNARSSLPSHCQIDVRGRQRDVLAGASRLIAQRRVLNVLIECNKRHTAAALRAAKQTEGGEDPTVPDGPLSEEDNEAATEDLVQLVQVRCQWAVAVKAGWMVSRIPTPTPHPSAQTLLDAGYDVLSTDRGWLRWQDPWGMGKDGESGEIRQWARRVFEHEIDLWGSLDATGGAPKPLLSARV